MKMQIDKIDIYVSLNQFCTTIVKISLTLILQDQAGGEFVLTYWSLDKTTTTLQTVFSTVFSSMKKLETLIEIPLKFVPNSWRTRHWLK